MTTMAVTCLPVSQSASHNSENKIDGIIHISNEENPYSEDWDDEDYLDITAEDDNLSDQSEFDDDNDFDDYFSGSSDYYYRLPFD